MFNPNKPVMVENDKIVREVEILATDIDSRFPIVAKVTLFNGVKAIRRYTLEGEEEHGNNGLDNLINIPETHVRYFNVYEDSISPPHFTRSGADDGYSKGRIACIRVEFKEGQYDE